MACLSTTTLSSCELTELIRSSYRKLTYSQLREISPLPHESGVNFFLFVSDIIRIGMIMFVEFVISVSYHNAPFGR